MGVAPESAAVGVVAPEPTVGVVAPEAAAVGVVASQTAAVAPEAAAAEVIGPAAAQAAGGGQRLRSGGRGVGGSLGAERAGRTRRLLIGRCIATSRSRRALLVAVLSDAGLARRSHAPVTPGRCRALRGRQRVPGNAAHR